MKLDLTQLYPLQKSLDEEVAKRLPESYQWGSFYHLEELNYAFHTEMHELANELGFFKFWKLGHEVDRDKAVEELVDCVHFLLSIAIVKGYDKRIKEAEISDFLAGNSLLELFSAVRELTVDSMGRYELALEYVLAIGWKLDVGAEDLMAAYLSKNAENVKRQQNEY